MSFFTATFHYRIYTSNVSNVLHLNLNGKIMRAGNLYQEYVCFDVLWIPIKKQT